MVIKATKETCHKWRQEVVRGGILEEEAFRQTTRGKFFEYVLGLWVSTQIDFVQQETFGNF